MKMPLKVVSEPRKGLLIFLLKNLFIFLLYLANLRVPLIWGNIHRYSASSQTLIYVIVGLIPRKAGAHRKKLTVAKIIAKHIFFRTRIFSKNIETPLRERTGGEIEVYLCIVRCINTLQRILDKNRAARYPLPGGPQRVHGSTAPCERQYPVRAQNRIVIKCRILLPNSCKIPQKSLYNFLILKMR